MWSALAIGLCFGFVIQRGGFCGAALLSSVVLERTGRGLAAVGVAILTSMLGFALLVQWDLVIPNPSPMRLLSAVVGGGLFGVGMVLSGGCVSGTLYKVAEGRLSSLLALIGIGIVANLVTPGALATARRALVIATREVKVGPGLHDATGLAYPLLGGLLALAGLAGLVWLLRRGSATNPPRPAWTWTDLRKRGWPTALSAFGVGLLGWLAYLASTGEGRNYPLGVVYGVKRIFGLAVGAETAGGQWSVPLVIGIVVGSLISARLRGKLAWRSGDAGMLIGALIGGVLVGAGALIGRGCFIGNVVSGVGLLSLHSLVFALFTVLANWLTTLIYVRGVQWPWRNAT